MKCSNIEQKVEKKEIRYQKTYEKWLRSEPEQWRFISHFFWRKRRPKYPSSRKNQ